LNYINYLYKLFQKDFGSRLGQQVFNNDNSTHFSITHIRNTTDISDFNLLLCAIRQMKKLERLEVHFYTSLEQQDILKNLWIKRGNNLNKLYLKKFKYRDVILSKRNESENKIQ